MAGALERDGFALIGSVLAPDHCDQLGEILDRRFRSTSRL